MKRLRGDLIETYKILTGKEKIKDDRQRFLQKVSKKQFRTVYYNANVCG